VLGSPPLQRKPLCVTRDDTEADNEHFDGKTTD
jgi:hypothetical protein